MVYIQARTLIPSAGLAVMTTFDFGSTSVPLAIATPLQVADTVPLDVSSEENVTMYPSEGVGLNAAVMFASSVRNGISPAS